jgi:hypothetical protein
MPRPRKGCAQVPAASHRHDSVMEAMLQMDKMEIDKLKEAYERG